MLNISNHQRKAHQNLKIELASSKRTQVTNADVGVEKRSVPTAGGDVNGVATLENSMVFLKIESPHDLVIPLLGIYSLGPAKGPSFQSLEDKG